MKLQTQVFGAILAGVLTVGLGASVADAQLIINKDEEKCRETIAKDTGKFIKATFKERAKCADKNLKDTGSCDFGKRDEKLDKAETKLRAGLQKKCGDPFTFPEFSMAKLGFPGKCTDADPSDAFTVDDLKDCMFDTHEAQVLALFDLQYGSNGDDGVIDFETRTGDASLAKDLGKCQKEIGKNGLKHVTTIQKTISKCRNGIQKGKTTGFLETACGFNTIEPKPMEKVQKSRTKVIAKITDKCAGLMANPELDVCDTGGGPITTSSADAGTCIADTHENATDDPENTGGAAPFPTDFIDFEYALGAICGDGILNEAALPSATVGGNFYLGLLAEECDGDDDAACPGECGGPFSSFPCLCQNTPRERVDEQDNSDLDNGWTGTSHDSTVVLGSGYWTELYDCDGPGGPDTECTVGPSCNNPPHNSCVSDAGCLGGGNFCRKTSMALGPHCNDDVQVTCTTNAACDDSPQDFCRKTPHGIPLPLSSGGISVCIVNVFSEDVVGTTDLATGDFEIRLRQDSVTHLGGGGPGRNHPCPSCGGFCASSTLSLRTLCQADSDCSPGVSCVTDAICSSGPNIDKPCRRLPPYGNSTDLFGAPSVDCPPTTGANISGPGLDILFNPSTSGSTSNPPDTNCLTFGFNTKKCILGADTGKDCIVDTDCAGAAVGSCAHQCPCPATGGLPAQPNGCNAACRGGTNDYESCTGDTDCGGGGFCQPNSCRAVNGLCRDGTNVGGACAADSDCPAGTCGDPDSSDEGFCPAGPTQGRCTTSTFVPCNTNDDCLHLCAGGPNVGDPCLATSDCPGSTCTGGCPECLKNNTETCVATNRDCYPNEGAVRTGVPGIPSRVGVAQYCIPNSGAPSVDSVAGLPGPGALSQPAITTPVGF